MGWGGWNASWILLPAACVVMLVFVAREVRLLVIESAKVTAARTEAELAAKVEAADFERALERVGDRLRHADAQIAALQLQLDAIALIMQDIADRP